MVEARYIPDADINPFFDAVIQTVEEAILNALVANQDMTGRDGNFVPALPHAWLESFPVGQGVETMATAEGLKFGTSGLRGLVTELVGWPAHAHALAFCHSMIESGMAEAGDPILVGHAVPARRSAATASRRSRRPG